MDEWSLSFLRGEERGYDHFFRLYFKALHFFAFKILSNETDAEDIVQECFARLWARRDLVKNADHIRSFLYTNVRNACISQLRKRKIKVVSGDFDEEQLLDSVLQDSEDHMIESEMLRLISEAASQLPARMKEIFFLYYINGKTDEQISQLLHISAFTVRNQRRRSIAIIRGKLNT